MKKILAAVVMVLGSLGSVQVYAQATVSAPFLEKLGIENARESKVVAAEQKFRDLQMLARELEQLQVFLKNLKRASPKLWDSSLNAFENLANATDPIDTIANAVKDFGGVLERSGCTGGVIESVPIPNQKAPNPDIDFNPGASSDAQIAAYRRGQLQRRCRELLTTLQTEEQIQKKAKESKLALQKQANNKEAGSNEIMDNMMSELVNTRVQMMQEQREITEARRQAIEKEFAEAARQQAMHDRLMKAPSSAKAIRSRDPALTVDPRNY